jgi:hypothetical protein
MPTHVNFKIVRGLPWKRFICVKSNLTHYRVNVDTPSAYVATSTTGKKQIDATITSEGIIQLALDRDETIDLPEGALNWDVWANVTVGLNDKVYQPVANGIIEVVSYETVTPSQEVDEMEIRYKQRTDYSRIFTWQDDDGDVLTVQSAFMQAKNTAGATVLDLRWYNTKPSEQTISELTANRRGYLIPSAGATLEMHISDMNTIAAGSYVFDLFVQDADGDWDCIAQGTLVVEDSISSPPA